jgi:hypothetical protein
LASLSARIGAIAKADYRQGRLMFGSLHRHEAIVDRLIASHSALRGDGFVLAGLHIRFDQLRRNGSCGGALSLREVRGS